MKSLRSAVGTLTTAGRSTAAWISVRVHFRREHAAVAAKARTVSERLRTLRLRVRADESARLAHLEGLLRLRAAVPREPRAPDAVAREAEFAARSSEYAAAALAWRQGEDPPSIRRTAIAGLQWSLPQDVSDRGSLSYRLLDRRRLPLEDIEMVRAFATGGIMLDIGANIGTTAIPRLVLGDFTCVYAAEPEEANYRCLVGNVIDNGLTGLVLPDRVAISSHNGTARLRHAAHIGGHQLMGADTRALPGEEVTCLTLDTWLHRLRVAPAGVRFVKVDTQGWDLHVLQGAADLLQSRQVVWQIEASPSMMKQAGSNVADLCTLVQARFTHVRQLGPRGAATFAPSSTIADLLASVPDGRRFANLLLFNLG